MAVFFLSWLVVIAHQVKKYTLLLFFSCFVGFAQQISVLDSLTQKSIPFVHVYDGTKGVIASEAGVFYWNPQDPADSLSLSCVGYASRKIAKSQLQDSIYLSPEAVALSAVVVSNRTLSADEIMERVLQNTAQNMDFGLSSSEVFVERKSIDETQKMDIDIKKSTIEELDQSFTDEMLQKIPEMEQYVSYTKSKWLRDSGGLKNHKLEVMQAANLIDSLNEQTFSSMEESIQEILDKRVKKNSYFKVKSGPLISIKIDNNSEEADTVAQDSVKIKAKDYAKRQLGRLQQLVNKKLFHEKNWALPFLEKPSKYSFSNEGILYDLGAPVYKLRFRSKKKKDFSGYLLVDVDDFGVHKIAYYSNRHLNRIKLFGLFYEEKLNNRTYVFVKNQINKYTLYQIKEETQSRFGLKRPIKIIEKNKIVKGRNRQNVLSMDVNLQAKNVETLNIYFNSLRNISKKEFDDFTLVHQVLPTDFYSLDAVREVMPGLPIN